MGASAAFMGAGMVFQAAGRLEATRDQAAAERENAGFYREQAAFAKATGERQRNIFDRESLILYGDQLSAFAKAGVDTSANSLFMAKTMLFRAQESNAIQVEADFNERLALLRATQAERTADDLEGSAGYTIASTAFGGMSSVL